MTLEQRCNDYEAKLIEMLKLATLLDGANMTGDRVSDVLGAFMETMRAAQMPNNVRNNLANELNGALTTIFGVRDGLGDDADRVSGTLLTMKKPLAVEIHTMHRLGYPSLESALSWIDDYQQMQVASWKQPGVWGPSLFDYINIKAQAEAISGPPFSSRLIETSSQGPMVDPESDQWMDLYGDAGGGAASVPPNAAAAIGRREFEMPTDDETEDDDDLVMQDAQDLQAPNGVSFRRRLRTQ